MCKISSGFLLFLLIFCDIGCASTEGDIKSIEANSSDGSLANVTELPMKLDKASTETAVDSSQSIPSPEQEIPTLNPHIKGPYFEFQHLPISKKFVCIKEISNILAFSKKEKSVLTTYHLIVVKAMPSLSVNCQDDITEPLLPIYCAFITEIYQNKWRLFTHFDPISGAIHAIPFDSLSIVLQCIQAEINLLMPDLKVKEGENSKIYDISFVYPQKWKQMIQSFLSPHKGGEHSIYSSSYKDNKKSIYDNLKITRHKVFDDLENGEVDYFVDIYRPLAALQSFWITEETQNSIVQLFGINPYPHQYAEFLMIFSDQHRPLPKEVNDGYIAILKTLHKFPTTLSDLGNAIQNARRKYIKETNTRDDVVSLLSLDMASYLCQKDFLALFESQHHTKLLETTKPLPLAKMIHFFKYIKDKDENLKKEEESYREDKKNIEALLASVDPTEENKKIIKKFFERLDRSSLIKQKEDEIFSFKNDVFSKFIQQVTSQKMQDLFEKQAILVKKFTSLQRIVNQTFNDQIQYMLEWLLIFYNLHIDCFQLGKNFEKYFEEMKSDVSDAIEDQDKSLSFEEKITRSAKEYQKKEIMNQFKGYEDIIHQVRQIYPGFGYLPTNFKSSMNKHSIEKEDSIEISAPLMPEAQPQEKKEIEDPEESNASPSHHDASIKKNDVKRTLLPDILRRKKTSDPTKR